MKKMIALLLLTSCLMGSALGESYSNPILLKNSMGQVMDAADPYVFRFNGMYYLYSTGAAEIRCYQSRDLVNWEYMGHCTQGGKVNIAYAPEVFYWRGDFYMITSPMGNGHYILKSDSPLGPLNRQRAILAILLMDLSLPWIMGNCGCSAWRAIPSSRQRSMKIP